MKNNKKGISLIVLIVTIVLILILVTTAVSTILSKRYFNRADYGNFLSIFESYKDELEDYIGNQEFLNNGRYNRESLYADNENILYNGEIIIGKTIKDIIPIISDDYLNDIKVYKGNLIYTGQYQNFKDGVNTDMNYYNKNLSLNYKRDVDEELETTPINISTNLTSNFTFEILFKEKSNSYSSGTDNFISSGGFIINEVDNTHKLYFGINSSDGKQTAYLLKEDKLQKVTYTYSASKKEGKLYINGKLLDSKIYSENFSTINTITIKGQREYYGIRVYDKELSYSEIKQNDFVDILNYGNWEE